MVNDLLRLWVHLKRKYWTQHRTSAHCSSVASPIHHNFHPLKPIHVPAWFHTAALHCFEWEVPHTPQIFDHCQTCVGWVSDKHALSCSTKSSLFKPTDDVELFCPHMQEAVCLRLNGSPEPGAKRECPLWGSDAAHAWQGAIQMHIQAIDRSQ